ncbi:mRNA binding protein puf3 [Exophiala xenobiotica]|uniref:Pumilio homology domain family member 3 n=1 Tax=Vermiconidia calcicola TaxID=1690605 RepID=A0AAV9QL92_9PEZI|nr:mRNA binding protein puf3 [Exophiala xenobiotica]KAK5545911.1 mRNA binding protein puf3 [Vermiconidia calcicola]KAK5549830.1 mRNA binding protein puf3 [Chaetothyriales sp. CCFEE 6169]KAK5229709.1 mRNA binding protein puf3 [Exophiala xenobiotica]KAK5286545.1 mRNA binding protein puf3 [Exophiala xenobiotica]
MDGGTTLGTSRTGRISAFDRTSSSRPQLGVETDFDRGKSAWNSTSRIWGTKPDYGDEQPTRPSPARQTSSTGFGPGRTATTSTRTPTEFEHEYPVQSKLPWSAVSTTVNHYPRQRTQPLSPTQQRQSQGPDFVTNNHNGSGEESSLFEGSAPDVEDEPLMGYPSIQKRRAVIDSSRFMQSPTRAATFGRTQYDPQIQAINAGNFNANSMFASRNGYEHDQDRLFNGYSATSISSQPYAVPNSYATGRLPEQPPVPLSRFDQILPQHAEANGRPWAAAQPEGFDSSSAQNLEEALQALQAFGIDRLHDMTDMNSLRRSSNTQPQYQRLVQPISMQSSSQPGPHFGNIESQFHPAAGNVPMPSRLNPQAVPHFGGLPYAGRANLSPLAHDYRSNLHSPYSSQLGTPPTGPLSVRSTAGSGVSSRTSHRESSNIDRKFPNGDQYALEHGMMMSGSLQHGLGNGFPYDMHGPMHTMGMNPLANPYMMSVQPAVNHYPSVAPVRVREPDQNQVVRSARLEEFRMNSKTNKRFELKDIYDHVVEFSGDQHGSRFIQQKLETANSDEKEQIFKEIQPNLLQLMSDVFGNYVIQKVFEHGNQGQKKVLANQMKGHIMHLSLQMYGCRVVQKAFEHVLTDQQASLVKELDGPNLQILKVVRDQNGNHVVQKAIERIPGEHIQFIVDAFKGQTAKMSTHQYGCRVVQRMLEHCQPKAKRIILDELLEHIVPLITDSYGNYVVQHIIQNGEPRDRRHVVNIVLRSLLLFSKHKFASNIVEKSIEFADEDQRQQILRGLTAPDEHGVTPVLGLMRDQYGNYVLQRVYARLQGEELAALLADMQKNYDVLRRTSYGKQVTAIHRIVYPDQSSSNASTGSPESVLIGTSTGTSTNGEVDRAATTQGEAE